MLRRSASHARPLLWTWALVAALTLFAVAPLTYPGFFQVQSGFLSPLNVVHLDEAPDFGRAARGLAGEGRLPYLIGWPVYRLSGSGTTAIEVGYGLAFLLGALGVFAWLKPWLGRRGAVLAATVYTYLPWHLATVYVRGAYAEAWLWAVWPLLLWSIDRLGRFLPAGPKPVASAALGLVALAAALGAQPGLTLLFLLLVVPYGAVQVSRLRPAAWAVAGLALGAGLLWIAVRLGWGSVPSPATGFLDPSQLFSLASGPADADLPSVSSPAAWSPACKTPFQLGVAALGLTVLALALGASRWRSSPPVYHASAQGGLEGGSGSCTVSAEGMRSAFWFWAAGLLGVVLLTLRPAALLWQVTGFGALLDRPWQLLALSGPPLAFVAGSITRLNRRLAVLPAWAGLVALAILAVYPMLAPRFTQVDPGTQPVALFQPPAEDTQFMILDAEILPPTTITPTVALTLTWQSLASVAEDYTAFVHLLAAGGGDKIAQGDSRPCGGECPTDAWQPGDLIVDRYQLDLPQGAPPGPYRLAVGLYRLESGERLPVLGSDDGTVTLGVPVDGQ